MFYLVLFGSSKLKTIFKNIQKMWFILFTFFYRGYNFEVILTITFYIAKITFLLLIEMCFSTKEYILTFAKSLFYQSINFMIKIHVVFYEWKSLGWLAKWIIYCKAILSVCIAFHLQRKVGHSSSSRILFYDDKFVCCALFPSKKIYIFIVMENINRIVKVLRFIKKLTESLGKIMKIRRKNERLALFLKGDILLFCKKIL